MIYKVHSRVPYLPKKNSDSKIRHDKLVRTFCQKNNDVFSGRFSLAWLWTL